MEFNNFQHSLLFTLERIFNKKYFLNFSFFRKKACAVYVHGAVGRGKTTAINAFFNNVKTQKIYMHHEHFMLFVYDNLSSMHVEELINKIRSEASLLWIDELQFRDMGETILLMKIIQSLLRNQVSVILSGNPLPVHLFANVHVHPEAQKALAFFQKTFHCFELSGEIDYRNRSVDDCGQRHFFFANEFNKFQRQFEEMALESPIKSHNLVFKQRCWIIEKSWDRNAWLDFDDTIVYPRSATDYQMLTENFDKFFLSIVPVLDDKNRDEIKRFIVLIDLIYEKGKQLFLCAEALPQNINQAKKSSLRPFERTSSRLTELCRIGDGF